LVDIARRTKSKTKWIWGSFTVHLTGIPLFLLTYIINGMVQIGEPAGRRKFIKIGLNAEYESNSFNPRIKTTK
jgi:hypothetical protein